jgi:hypothetical protein
MSPRKPPHILTDMRKAFDEDVMPAARLALDMYELITDPVRQIKRIRLQNKQAPSPSKARKLRASPAIVVQGSARNQSTLKREPIVDAEILEEEVTRRR